LSSDATSYHAGRFLQLRSPMQKAYFPEDGTVLISARNWPFGQSWALVRGYEIERISVFDVVGYAGLT
jgi:hypothetical protein